jgi:PIN domain nuclease of toxin-antitoxin system
MNLLLDTHIAVWAVTGDANLPAAALAILNKASNTPLVSMASLWEIAIKTALVKQGRGAMALTSSEAAAAFEAAGFVLLPVSVAHCAVVETLPPLHADPFDRMLVAQALHEPMRLVTRDRQVAAYSDTAILV